MIDDYEEITMEELFCEDLRATAKKYIETLKDGNEVSSFLWAVDMMRQGKKVRRNYWTAKAYCYYENVNNGITMHYGSSPENTMRVTPWDIEATDWEIYQVPRKTLWDYRQDVAYIEDIPEKEAEYVWVERVKEALQELLEWEEIPVLGRPLLREKAKEIFGEQMLKEDEE